MIQTVRFSFIISVMLVLATAGCKKEQSRPSPKEREAAADPFDMPAEEPRETSEAAPEEPPPPTTIPEVVLSNELRTTCLLGVGEKMPPAELAGLDGEMHELSGLYGPRLSVVCFWTIGAGRRSQLVAEAVLRDLTKGVVAPFEDQGVRVIAVNVGDPVEDVRRYADQAGAEYLCLLDPDGAYYARIATERKTPRTFLLDAEGTVLWFDLEYSNTARRDLAQGIRAALSEKE